MADLLGCVCLDSSSDDKCLRNCCLNKNTRFKRRRYHQHQQQQIIIIKFDPATEMNDVANVAYQKICDEEDRRPTEQVTAVEAWSNGTVYVWW